MYQVVSSLSEARFLQDDLHKPKNWHNMSGPAYN